MGCVRNSRAATAAKILSDCLLALDEILDDAIMFKGEAVNMLQREIVRRCINIF